MTDSLPITPGIYVGYMPYHGVHHKFLLRVTLDGSGNPQYRVMEVGGTTPNLYNFNIGGLTPGPVIPTGNYNNQIDAEHNDVSNDGSPAVARYERIDDVDASHVELKWARLETTFKEILYRMPTYHPIFGGSFGTVNCNSVVDEALFKAGLSSPKDDLIYHSPGSWSDWTPGPGHWTMPVGYPVRVWVPLPPEKSKDLAADAAEPLPVRRIDPLLLDLNGDGIQTTAIDRENLSNNTFFDINANGFQELTAWIDEEDGILVRDINHDGLLNDGSELFGDQTRLSNGSLATGGFNALADLDSNLDGKIDINDSVFSELYVFRGDGTFLSMEEAGIKALNLSSTSTNTVDENGNTQLRLGNYTKLDDSTEDMGDYLLASDHVISFDNDVVPISDEIATLPFIAGMGNIHSLDQAMMLDETGSLKIAVEAFIAETDHTVRGDLVDTILYKWAGSENRSADEFGGLMDGRKVGVMDVFYAHTYNFLDALRADRLNLAYFYHKEFIYSQLLLKTHYSDLYNLITAEFDTATNNYKLNFDAVQAKIEDELTTNQMAGLERLGEFARAVKGLELETSSNWSDFYRHFANQSDNYAWAMNTSGKNEITIGTSGNDNRLGSAIPDIIIGLEGNDTLQGGNGCDAIDGGTGNDILQGQDGDDFLTGGAGDDTMVGGIGNDHLIGGDGNDTLEDSGGTQIASDDYLEGRDGNDVINAHSGNDTIIGGTGNDTLYGQDGNDLYVFELNDGVDKVTENNQQIVTPENDTIQFGTGIDKADVTFSGVGQDLIITIDPDGRLGVNAPTNIITVETGLEDPSLTTTASKIENYSFLKDGTIYSFEDVIPQLESHGTSNGDAVYGATYFADKLYGYAGHDYIGAGNGTANDSLYGGTGNDVLEAYAGDDLLQGDEGDDTLYGGTGNDTYKFAASFGNDAISDSNGNNTLDVSAFTGNQAIDLSTSSSFTNSSDSVSWTSGDISNIITGSGNDTLTGDTNNNVLVGGSGNDSLSGGSGNDTYRFSAGFGTDTISDASGNNTLDLSTFAAGVSVDLSSTSFTESVGNTVNWTSGDIKNLTTGSGNDTLTGSSSANVLAGGTGNDTYVLDDSFGQDTITENAASGTDTLDLSAVSSDLTVNLISSAGDEVSDGTNTINWSGNHIEKVIGGSGNDSITGSNADDQFIGGAGNDSVIGEEGNDTYLYSDGFGIDSITETTAEGSDTVNLSNVTEDLTVNLTSGAGDEVSYDANNTINWSGDHIENVIGGSGNDTISGSSGDNRITGGTGADSLSGGTGNDTYLFAENFGSDTIAEGSTEGTDTIDLSAISSNLTINLASGAGDEVYLDTSNKLNWSGDYVENVIAGSGNDTLIGNTGDNNLISNTGNDTIQAAGGNDTLDGGSGNDSLEGGSGNDTYIGLSTTSGTDTVNDASGTDSLTVNANTYQAIWSAVDTDSDGNVDRLVVDFGGSNSIVINNFFDDTSAEALNSLAGTGVIESLAFNDQTLNFAGVQTTIASANVYTGTDGSDSMQGLAGNDVLDGGAGNDALNAGTDDDILIGGSGNDSLDGGSGSDIYAFDSDWGVDTITDASGTDTIDFRNVSNSLTLDLSSNSATQGSNTLAWSSNAINNAVGGIGNDTITGSNGDNYLDGRSGNDSLTSGDGNDTLSGGVGNDTLDGGTGTNTYLFDSSWGTDSISGDSGTGTIDLTTVSNNLTINLTAGAGNEVSDGSNTINWTGDIIENVISSSGNDTITGSSGNNIIQGGAGNDSLSGGSGDDTYVFDGDFGTDTISDASGSNTLSFASLNQNIALNLATATSFTDPNDSNNTASWGSGNIQNLTTGSGNDTLTGSTAANILVGGSGNDTYSFGSGFGLDTVVENTDEGTDTIDLSGVSSNLTVYLAAGAGDEVSDGTNTINWSGNNLENVVGGSGNDSITGSSSANRITGGSGDDTLAGSTGDDTYIYGNSFGNETITENAAEGSDTVDLSTVTSNLTINLASSGSDEVYLDSSNKINWSGDYVENVIGGSGNDSIVGNSADNQITGGAGNDTLSGGTGNDTYIFATNFGTDTINDASGSNTLDFSAFESANAVSLNLSSNTSLTQGGNTVSWTLGDIQNLTTGAGNDNLTGNSGANILITGAGNDMTGVHFGLDEKVECVGLYHLPEGIAGICRIPANGELVGSLVA